LQAPVIKASGPLKFCSGDSVVLSVNGTYAAYQWSGGATTSSIVVKKSGTYYLYVKDANGCSAYSSAVVVTVDQKPSVQISSLGNLCIGADTLRAYVSPSNLNYSYNWSTGETSQMILVTTPGTYSVTVTSLNGCGSASAYVIVQVTGSLPAPVITYNGSTTFCPGSSLTLYAPSGYTYLWSNQATTQSITVSASGSYTVTVKNSAGCKGTSAAVTVNVQPLTITLNPSGQVAFCASGRLYATSVTPPSSGMTYQWTLNGSPISGATASNHLATVSGVYNVIVKSGNCQTTSSSIYVTINPNPVPVITASGSTNICQTGYVVLTGSGGTGTFTYQWKLNGVDITGATSQKYTANAKGSYSVTITNSYGCKETSQAIGITSCRIAKPEAEPFNVSISPNPSSSEFNVAIGGNEVTVNINIYDLTGRLLQSSIHQASSGITIGSALRQGIYLVEIISANDKKLMRIVKTE
jgi:hypothetical protein